MTDFATSHEAFCPRTGEVCDFRVQLLEARERYRDGQSSIIESDRKHQSRMKTLNMFPWTAPTLRFLSRVTGIQEPDLSETIRLAQEGIVFINDALRAQCNDLEDCGAGTVYVAAIDRRDSRTTEQP